VSRNSDSRRCMKIYVRVCVCARGAIEVRVKATVNVTNKVKSNGKSKRKSRSKGNVHSE
jgi:hypothetical protein